MFKKVLLILIIYISISFTGEAKTKSFRSGITLNTIKLNDQAVSSLTHGNTLAGFYFAFRLQSDKSYQSISFNNISGNLYNKESHIRPKMSQYCIDYVKTWNIKNYLNSPIGLGLNLHTQNTNTEFKDFKNNPFYGTFYTSLSPVFRIEKKLINKKEKPVDISFTGSFLIFSYIIRPSIASALPINYSGEVSQGTDQYFTSGRFSTLNKFQYYQTSTAIDFHPGKRILFSIGYNWSFLRYKVDPVYYEINHQIFMYVGIQF